MQNILKGKIVNIIADKYQVEEDNSKKIYDCVVRGKFRKDNITPQVGDNVICDMEDSKKSAVISQILPRKNSMIRPKISNLTKLILVVSMKDPIPDLYLLDKQLALAQFLKIQAVICLNKIDLVEKEKAEEIKNMYEKIGYKVILTNAKKKEQVLPLLEEMKDNITAFSGNSGVGKSTLINAIFEEEKTEEGDISKKNKKGKNTTTNVCLYRIKDNSYIADTPGFSTFDAYEIPYQDLSHYFIEFEQFMRDCKYTGCSHILEDECMVKEALRNGKIFESRYKSYSMMYTQLKEKQKRR